MFTKLALSMNELHLQQCHQLSDALNTCYIASWVFLCLMNKTPQGFRLWFKKKKVGSTQVCLCLKLLIFNFSFQNVLRVISNFMLSECKRTLNYKYGTLKMGSSHFIHYAQIQ